MAGVMELANLCNWRIYHTRDSRGSQPGFPDLVLVKPPQVIFMELKSPTGRTTVAQREWLADLGRCEEVETRLYRPADWPEIENLLRWS